MLLPFLRNKTESRMCVLGCWGAGGDTNLRVSNQTLVEYVQLLALDGRPTWSSFLGLETKSSTQHL